MEFVHIQTYQSRIEAELAKGKLEAEGIKSLIIPTDSEGYVYAITRGDIGAKLMVQTKQSKQAKNILQI